MAHGWNGGLRETAYTERQKFSNYFESLVKTSELATLKINDIKKLHAEIESNLEKLLVLKSEIETIALKWGAEPIPTKEIHYQIETSRGISIAMPLYALE